MFFISVNIFKNILLSSPLSKLQLTVSQLGWFILGNSVSFPSLSILEGERMNRLQCESSLPH